MGFGYGILIFSPKITLFGGFEGVFSYKTDKSAILCPDKTEVADFVSFKSSIVHRISVEKMGEIWYNYIINCRNTYKEVEEKIKSWENGQYNNRNIPITHVSFWCFYLRNIAEYLEQVLC